MAYTTEQREALHANVIRGRQAMEIINSPLWQEIQKETKEGLMDAFIGLDPTDEIEKMKDVLFALRAFKKVQEKLEAIAEIGRQSADVEHQLTRED